MVIYHGYLMATLKLPSLQNLFTSSLSKALNLPINNYKTAIHTFLCLITSSCSSFSLEKTLPIKWF